MFDRTDNLPALAHKLEPFIDAGDIHGAKSWNEDPSGLSVYGITRLTAGHDMIFRRRATGENNRSGCHKFLSV